MGGVFINRIEYFDKLAYKWDEICYHDDEKLKKIIELSEIKNNSRLLDVGTGTGIMLKYLLQTNPAEITAVDMSNKMLERARNKYNDDRITFICKDILELEINDYDYAMLYSVYPHIQNKELFFRNIANILNDDGRIIIAHSESIEQINSHHSLYKSVKNDVLLPIEYTSKIMSRYFKILKMVSNEDMYYIMGVKSPEKN